MVVLLAGRAAEQLIFGSISTGAADDLAKTTDIARQMVTRFGMSPDLGQAVLEKSRASYLGNGGLAVEPRDYAEATAREVDIAVRALIDAAYVRAQADPAGQARRPRGRGRAPAGQGDDHARGLPAAAAATAGARGARGDESDGAARPVGASHQPAAREPVVGEAPTGKPADRAGPVRDRETSLAASASEPARPDSGPALAQSSPSRNDLS